MRRWLGNILIACCSLLLLVLGAPDAKAEDKAKAVRLLEKGDKTLARGDRYMEQMNADKAIATYEEALALYKQAYEEFNNPKIYFPIARAYHRLGQYMDAMEHYQAMLRESENPKPELVAEVDKAIGEVQKELVALDLTVAQDGAVVSIDGKDIGLTPLDGPHYITPGEHKYTITLEGYSPKEEVIDLNPGEVATRNLRLDALRVTVEKKKVSAKKSRKKQASGRVSKKPLTISFGVAGAMLVGAGFTGLAATARHDRYQNALSAEEREAARDSGRNYSLITDVLLAGGAIAAGYGLYYYYAEYKPGKETSKLASRVRIAPYASGNGGGVALGATF